MKEELPPLARLDSIELSCSTDDDIEKGVFRIIPSEKGEKGVGIPTDAAVCDECLKEMFDPTDRRYLYPFTNCTNCGARFTVIDDLPYDRDRTSMRDFPMDTDCRNEYEDPRTDDSTIRPYHALIVVLLITSWTGTAVIWVANPSKRSLRGSQMVR